MEVYVEPLIKAIFFILGVVVSSLFCFLFVWYYRDRYKKLKNDFDDKVDEKVDELIHLMDIEMFKNEKELVERKYKNREDEDK